MQGGYTQEFNQTGISISFNFTTCGDHSMAAVTLKPQKDNKKKLYYFTVYGKLHYCFNIIIKHCDFHSNQKSSYNTKLLQF